MNDFLEKIEYWPVESLKVLRLFLGKEQEVVTYDDIASQLKDASAQDNILSGKSVGGILSSIRRTKLNGKPLIVPIGRVLGSRRLQWRLNTEVITSENKEKVTKKIEKILVERGTF